MLVCYALTLLELFGGEVMAQTTVWTEGTILVKQVQTGHQMMQTNSYKLVG